jgi:hypothetical protein
MFNLAELSSFQNTFDSSLQDSCTIDKYSATYNSVGEPIETWISGNEIDCGLEMTGGIERYKGQIIVLDIDAVIRLPQDTVIDTRDRVTITKRFGVSISGIQFEITGFPKIGAAGCRVQLKRIEE